MDFLFLKMVFHRVFDGQDVAADQRRCGWSIMRGQGGAFTCAGGTHHQEQPALFHDEITQNGGYTQATQRRNFCGDVANHCGIAATLAHGAEAEVAHTCNGMGHVELARGFKLFDALGRQDLGQQVARGLRGQQLVVDRNTLTIDPNLGRGIGRQVNV
jgi:hypothetical protein